MTREEVIESLENIKYLNAYHRCREGIAIDMAIEALKEPERKHGEWKIDGIAIVCDLCGAEIVLEQGDVDMNYCPQCGADMRGEQE